MYICKNINIYYIRTLYVKNDVYHICNTNCTPGCAPAVYTRTFSSPVTEYFVPKC